MRNLIKQMNAAQQKTAQNNRVQHQYNTPQLPFSQAAANHQPYMVPNTMYQQNGYQFQDWNNFNNNNNYRGGRGGRGRGGRSDRGGRGGRRERKYCWTHGLQGRTGRECHTPMQGHQAEATLENRMGGNTRGVNA